MITPAISVLSAVEGLELMQPGLADVVLPSRSALLAVLFFVQRRGTAHNGKLFGPIMWLVPVARVSECFHRSRAWRARGGESVVRNRFWSHPMWPCNHRAASRHYRREALYADMDTSVNSVHIACPAVLPRCYSTTTGRRALLSNGGVSAPLTPWFRPRAAVMIILATRRRSSHRSRHSARSRWRAGQLICPDLRILQTSAEEQGQIYVPSVNRAAVRSVRCSCSFKNSDRCGRYRRGGHRHDGHDYRARWTSP